MSDLISRQAAIKAIEDLPNCYNGFSDTYDKACIIGVLEEVPPAQQWIPVLNDSISREEALEAIKHAELGCEYDEVKELPSAQQWIPCSERLPEKRIEVLTYCSEIKYIEIQSLEHNLDTDTTYWENQQGDTQDFYGVDAWMPLPEPYTEE